MIRIQKINHVALRVDDVAATAAFYVDVLGLIQGTPPPVDSDMLALIGHVKTSSQVSGPTGGTWIEAPGSQLHLIKAEASEGRINPFGPHLALEVDSIEDAKQTLTERRIPFLEPPSGSPFRQLWLLDPSGNTVELWMRR